MATNNNQRKRDPMSIAEQSGVETVQIQLPVGEYRHPEQRHPFREFRVRVNSRQAIALKKLLDGLDMKSADLASGTHVKCPFHAVCWMLEQYADSLEQLGESV